MRGARPPRPASVVVLACVVFAALVSCAQEEYPAWLWARQHPAPASGADEAGVDAGPRFCAQARAEALPQRLVAMSAKAGAGGGGQNQVLESDLFQSWVSVCGTCHGPSVDPPGLGGFQIQTASGFSTQMTASILTHVTSSVCPSGADPSSPTDPMPPCSSPNGHTYTSRSETDPVRQLAELIGQWLAAGSPASFTPTTPDAGSDAGASPASLSMTREIGETLTNMGNCVPTAGLTTILPGSAADTKSAALDATFAAAIADPTSPTAAGAIGLPEHLSETDLFTFDSAVLAQYRVVAYVPTYPLWSDDAGKLRYVRVPRGESIGFDKATQSFQIPANTRFYKTFMKQIVDTDGSYRYRKIETRLIVARPDQNHADGTVTQTALFGTYKYNDDESDAVLVETPLNSGEPFGDTLLLYSTDEPLAADILRGQPADQELALVSAGAARHYAIPSSQRCVQCHMGSPSESFNLGFTPLQLNQRPVGKGGVIEANGPDELTQLARFIDYGIVTGVDAPSDVLPLERSQGARQPRNDYELKAQGYMLGNCAHCHNPRGLPTMQDPALRDILDYLPSATFGGVFQFPLERTSPDIGRGLTGTTPIPFITPSLMDLPRRNPATGAPAGDPFSSPSSSGEAAQYVVYAPWRSLIYRNVDTAFAYTDDSALFPHMPMNTPGYDARAKQIMSDWMVSIPAVRVHPEIPEYAFEGGLAITCDTGVIPTTAPVIIGGGAVDETPQPYVEVFPGDPAYEGAVAAAKQRLSVLHTGKNPEVPIDPTGGVFSRYSDPGETDDIEDPAVLIDPLCHLVPSGCQQLPASFISQGVPYVEHPNWVITDTTVAPGPYSPKRADWTTVLAGNDVPPAGGTCGAPAGAEQAYEDQVTAVGLLETATLDQVRTVATTPVPFGLWKTQAGCKFSSVPTVASFTGPSRPNWMSVTNPPASAPVYMETPGAAVFKMICINCHGPLADGNGRQAQNLATMTGGFAVPADFRDGLFGPVGASEETSNRHLAFGEAVLAAAQPTPITDPNWTSVTDDDRAARYMPWLALGGTQKQIPLAILEIISATKVLDLQRTVETSSLSANMLSQAKALCFSILGPGYRDSLLGAYFDPTPGRGYLDAWSTHLNDQLLFGIGDAELWMNLCLASNPQPVHVLTPNSQGPGLHVTALQDDQLNFSINLVAPGTLIRSTDYPPGAPVGDEYANVVTTGLVPGNRWPWCVAMNPEEANGLPVCPASVLSLSRACPTNGNVGCFGDADAESWSVRGAINAGMSVYLYVQSIDSAGPPPDYDQCQLLK